MNYEPFSITAADMYIPSLRGRENIIQQVMMQGMSRAEAEQFVNHFIKICREDFDSRLEVCPRCGQQTWRKDIGVCDTCERVDG